MNEFFTKRRSFPPILLGVALLIFASYQFFLAFGPERNLQQGIDVDEVLQESRNAIAESEASIKKIQSFEDARIRGDEREMREAGEEMQRHREELMRKADERALLSKERERQRSASIQGARWTTAIVGGIVLLIAAMEFAMGYNTIRGVGGVSRSKNEEAASALPKQA